jgi:glutamine synthetase
MTVTLESERLDELRRAAVDGVVHTVRVGWSDRLGVLRGKRVPVEDFLADPERRIGFCDGMIVVDVHAGIIQETPFSNFETGYPDMYVRPRLETLRRAAWTSGDALVLGQLQSHHGEPLSVAPRNALAALLDRLASAGTAVAARLTLSGRLMHAPTTPASLLPGGRTRDEDEPGTLRAAAEGLIASGVPVESIVGLPDGRFTVALATCAAAEAADHAVIAKAALKEVALRHGLTASFMTRTPGAPASSELLVELELDGEGVSAPDPEALARALGDVRALLQPSVNAFKAGPAPTPQVVASAATVVSGLRAASEADPATALAAMVAAVVAPGPASGDDPVPTDLHGAAGRLDRAGWVRDWLGAPLVDNAVPLLRHEAELFNAAVTDWETERYWRQG